LTILLASTIRDPDASSEALPEEKEGRIFGTSGSKIVF
jgi:hypothetical protein